MVDSLVNLSFLVAGILAVGIVIWLVMRNKASLAAADARASGDVERTSLTEKLNAASKQIESLNTRLTDKEGHAEVLQTTLDTVNRESAQYAERANRLPVVEAAQKETATLAEKLQKDFSDSREMNGRLTADVAGKEKRLSEFEKDHQLLSTQRDNLVQEHSILKTTIAELDTTLENERIHSQEKLTLLTEAREQLSNQFKALANEILEEKSKKFTDQNKTNLGQLLNPLKQQLTDFKAKVEEVYVNEGKDRTALIEQVRNLTQLNSALSQETQNLTLALKGDHKAQGDWGEIILDDVLEKAGLLRGQHYDRQSAIKSEDGQSHVIPDVVIHLPGDRHLVVDSKMTLPDYRAYSSSEDKDERASALKRHLMATRAHIKTLSEKNYQDLYGLRSLDCVVMFIPLEPAFMLAITNDSELFQQAWDKNVLLVSPSTLLFVIRTVAHLWRQEDLSRNAKDISNRGAELYNKLVGFVTDLQKVGDRIQQAQDSYNEARKKFSEGGGNVIRQAEMLRKLGVKPNKTMPSKWIEPALDEPLPSLTNESADYDATELTDEFRADAPTERSGTSSDD